MRCIAVDPNHFDGDSMRAALLCFQEATAKEFTSDGFFRWINGGFKWVMAWRKWDEGWMEKLASGNLLHNYGKSP